MDDDGMVKGWKISALRTTAIAKATAIVARLPRHHGAPAATGTVDVDMMRLDGKDADLLNP
jgi:hypothetical protein